MRTIDELKEAIPEDEGMLNERIKSLSETDRQAIKEVFDLITTEWSAAEVEMCIRDSSVEGSSPRAMIRIELLMLRALRVMKTFTGSEETTVANARARSMPACFKALSSMASA